MCQNKYFEIIDSTNEYIKREIKDILEYEIIQAKIQTKGKGRRGNNWISQEGMCMFSFYIKEQDIKNSIIIGASVLSVLQEISQKNIMYKWPNDIYLDDKKLCGILIEGFKNVSIIGIGINVKNIIHEEIKNIAISLNIDINLKDLACKIVKKFIEYRKLEFRKIISYINKYNQLNNQNINVKAGNKRIYGKALNISENGELMVLVDGNIKPFSYGEIFKTRVFLTNQDELEEKIIKKLNEGFEVILYSESKQFNLIEISNKYNLKYHINSLDNLKKMYL